MKRVTVGLVAMAAATLAAAGLSARTVAPSVPSQPGLTLTTTAFEDGGIIPDKYTKAIATPVSPELAWTHVPNGTMSFVLMMRDPDTALNRRTDEVLHWLMFNIPGTSRGLPEAVPIQAQLGDGSTQLLNQFKGPGYGAPGAAAAGPYHHYTLELYALDIRLNLGAGATEANVQSAMQGHILAKAVTVGRFHRQ